MANIPSSRTPWLQRSWAWVLILCLMLLCLSVPYACMHMTKSWPGPGEERVLLDQSDHDILRRMLARTADTTKSQGGTPFAEHPARKAVINYLTDRLDNWVSTDSTSTVRLMDQLHSDEVLSYLSNAKFHVRSYFWLSGWPAILEVFFWTLFGTVCSLLYNIYDVRRQNAVRSGCANDDEDHGFDASEIPNHLAKLAFSPFVSLIIIFGYKYLAEDGSNGLIETSTGVIMIAFLLGFYSARAMRMLDRIKDVLLPYDSSASPKVVPPVNTDNVEVAITLTLAPALLLAHPDHTEELNAELDAAIVQFTPTSGGATIIATHSGAEQEARFVAQLPSGTYTVQATVSTTVGINLSGTAEIDPAKTKTAEVVMDDSGSAG